MLAHLEAGPNAAFRQLAEASARLYPTFLHTLRDESGIAVDLRTEGKICFLDDNPENIAGGKPLIADDLGTLEPELTYRAPAILLPQNSLDPRQLIQALVATAKHLGVHLASGNEVTAVESADGHITCAETHKTKYSAGIIVNCAGAWAGHISPTPLPTRPIKGQMLCLVHDRSLITHVIQGNGVYLIPRTDHRIAIGSTVEDVGFDKRVDPGTIQLLHQRAASLVPACGQALIHDSWAGLRPCLPDHLPALGKTSLEGYFVATGHYRDGILLAPITAHVMSQTIRGEQPDVDLTPFSPLRFESQ